MTHTATMPRVGQALSGVILLGIAVAAGIKGLMINVTYGSETGAGLVFGLADLAEMIIPIVAGVIGWSLQLRATAVICVAVSLFCATQYYSAHNGQHHAEQQHGASVYNDTGARITELQTQIASLDAQAASEAKNKGCGKQCKFFTERALSARQELAEARTARANAKPVEVAETGGVTSAIMMAAGIVILKALAWLSVPAMTLLGQAMKKTTSSQNEHVVVVAKKPRKRRAKKAKKPDWTKLETYAAPTPKAPKKLDGRTREARALKKMAVTAAND